MTETTNNEPTLNDVFRTWEEYCAEQVDFVARKLKKRKQNRDDSTTTTGTT